MVTRGSVRSKCHKQAPKAPRDRSRWWEEAGAREPGFAG